ncbi:lysine-sensitive aspartokinase 3 [Salinispira pacifica]
MIVLKFGGTSVQDAARMDRVLDIADRQLDRAPILVSSAMGKTTDRLVRIGEDAVAGNARAATEGVDALRTYHHETADAFLTGENLGMARIALDDLFGELGSLVKGLILIRECTARTSDALLSFGELLSTTLLSFRAQERGIPAEFLDSRHFIKTDEEFTHAAVDFARTNAAIQQMVRPEPGRLLIAQGFIGSTEKGVTTTLGRGGSDYTATILGSALEAEEVQIWTDVNGIMTADPRVVPEAVSIPVINYDEAAELAYFGAKVVHPSTIQPAVEKGIAVWVKNSVDPDGPATRIAPEPGSPGLRAIASKKRITLITIDSSRMLNAYGFLSAIFAVFEKHRISVDLIATSEVSVSMTVDTPLNVERAVSDLSSFGRVTVEQGNSIICLVGRDLWKETSFIARVFTVLQGTPVRLISLGSSDINLSLVVPEGDADRSVRQLHGEFFPNVG